MISNRNRTLHPQKYLIYTLNNYPGGPNFVPFHSMTSRLLDIRSSKIGNALNDPPTHPPTQTKLEHLTVKSTLYTKNLPPGAQILVRFALPLAVSEIQGRQKLKMHRMTPN